MFYCGSTSFMLLKQFAILYIFKMLCLVDVYHNLLYIVHWNTQSPISYHSIEGVNKQLLYTS